MKAPVPVSHRYRKRRINPRLLWSLIAGALAVVEFLVWRTFFTVIAFGAAWQVYEFWHRHGLWNRRERRRGRMAKRRLREWRRLQKRRVGKGEAPPRRSWLLRRKKVLPEDDRDRIPRDYWFD